MLEVKPVKGNKEFLLVTFDQTGLTLPSPSPSPPPPTTTHAAKLWALKVTDKMHFPYLRCTAAPQNYTIYQRGHFMVVHRQQLSFGKSILPYVTTVVDLFSVLHNS